MAIEYEQQRLVGQPVTCSSVEREIRGSNLGPVKLDTVLPMARNSCDTTAKGAVLPGRNDAEMGPTNSLQASAYYSDYHERFDLNMSSFRIWYKITDSRPHT